MAYSDGSQTKLLRAILCIRKQEKFLGDSVILRYLFLQEAENSDGLSALNCDGTTFPRIVVGFVHQFYSQDKPDCLMSLVLYKPH